eukprot:scaffold1397_cov254-Pinguiococcus_pyrenoidosus.AAC.58
MLGAGPLPPNLTESVWRLATRSLAASTSDDGMPKNARLHSQACAVLMPLLHLPPALTLSSTTLGSIARKPLDNSWAVADSAAFQRSTAPPTLRVGCSSSLLRGCVAPDRNYAVCIRRNARLNNFSLRSARVSAYPAFLRLLKLPKSRVGVRLRRTHERVVLSFCAHPLWVSLPRLTVV